MNEVKNNSPKRPVIFYYAIARYPRFLLQDIRLLVTGVQRVVRV